MRNAWPLMVSTPAGRGAPPLDGGPWEGQKMRSEDARHCKEAFSLFLFLYVTPGNIDHDLGG
jgi:hypothetical protein